MFAFEATMGRNGAILSRDASRSRPRPIQLKCNQDIPHTTMTSNDWWTMPAKMHSFRKNWSGSIPSLFPLTMTNYIITAARQCGAHSLASVVLFSSFVENVTECDVRRQHTPSPSLSFSPSIQTEITRRRVPVRWHNFVWCVFCVIIIGWKTRHCCCSDDDSAYLLLVSMCFQMFTLRNSFAVRMHQVQTQRSALLVTL